VKFGSEASDEMSPLEAPMTIPIPMFAKALIMAGSDPYSRTFCIEVDWRSFAVAEGGGRLSATCP
jgi:hypothetical protein